MHTDTSTVTAASGLTGDFSSV